MVKCLSNSRILFIVTHFFSLILNGNLALPKQFQRNGYYGSATQMLVSDISIYYRKEIMRAAARRVALFIIARYGEGDLAVFPQDLIKLSANEVWETREDPICMDASEGRLRNGNLGN